METPPSNAGNHAEFFEGIDDVELGVFLYEAVKNGLETLAEQVRAEEDRRACNGAQQEMAIEERTRRAYEAQLRGE